MVSYASLSNRDTHACLDACFIHQVRLELRTSDLQAVMQTSHVVHVVDSRILQMSKECVQVRMGNLYSASKTGMVTFKYVVGSTTVVTNTQPCLADSTFCYPVSLNVRYISLRRLLLWVESESSSPWMSTTAGCSGCLFEVCHGAETTHRRFD